MLYPSPQCVHVAASFLASLSLLFGVCVCVCVAPLFLRVPPVRWGDGTRTRWLPARAVNASLTPNYNFYKELLQMHVWTWRAQVSRQLYCGEGGGEENFSMREGKTNLETDKWSSLFSETVSSLRDGAVITEFFCHGFCFSAGEMPSHWPRIRSALITDCGCMLINDRCSKKI